MNLKHTELTPTVTKRAQVEWPRLYFEVTTY